MPWARGSWVSAPSTQTGEFRSGIEHYFSKFDSCVVILLQTIAERPRPGGHPDGAARLHYLLFYLAPAMNPRYLSTVDTDLKSTSISVRVGLAVETVGQAGRPKTITGFQVSRVPIECFNKILLYLSLSPLRRTRRQCCWATKTAQSWRAASTRLSRQCWRASSSSRRRRSPSRW